MELISKAVQIKIFYISRLKEQNFGRILWSLTMCRHFARNKNALTAEVKCVAPWMCRINPLTPNDHYSGRTAPLTSKRCILYIYSTNIGTAHFKHGINSPFFPFKMQFVS